MWRRRERNHAFTNPRGSHCLPDLSRRKVLGNRRRIVHVVQAVEEGAVRLGDYYGPEPRKLATESVENVEQGPSVVPNVVG